MDFKRTLGEPKHANKNYNYTDVRKNFPDEPRGNQNKLLGNIPETNGQQ